MHACMATDLTRQPRQKQSSKTALSQCSSHPPAPRITPRNFRWLLHLGAGLLPGRSGRRDRRPRAAAPRHTRSSRMHMVLCLSHPPRRSKKGKGETRGIRKGGKIRGGVRDGRVRGNRRKLGSLVAGRWGLTSRAPLADEMTILESHLRKSVVPLWGWLSAPPWGERLVHGPRPQGYGRLRRPLGG